MKRFAILFSSLFLFSTFLGVASHSSQYYSCEAWFTDDFPQLKQDLPPFWKSYISSYEKNGKLGMRGPEGILSTIWNRENAGLDLMKKFGLKNRFGFRAPDLHEMMKHCRATQCGYLSDGRIGLDGAIVPAAILLVNKTDYIAVPYGMPLPEIPGVDSSSTEMLSGMLPDNVFLGLISQGFMPQGKPISIIQPYLHSSALHDGFHDFAFTPLKKDNAKWMKRAEYMAALRPGALRMLTENKFDAAGKFEERGAQIRSFTAFESLSLVSFENRAKLFKALDLPAVQDHSIDSIEYRLKKLSLKELLDYRYKLRSKLDPLIDRFGGSAFDFFINAQGQHFKTIEGYNDPFYDSFMQIHYQALIEQVRDIRGDHFFVTPEKLIRRLARLEMYLIESTKISAPEWVEESLRAKVSESSKIHEFVCTTGIWAKDSSFYKAYCR